MGILIWKFVFLLRHGKGYTALFVGGFSDGYRFPVTGLLRTAGTFKEVSKPQTGHRAFRWPNFFFKVFLIRLFTWYKMFYEIVNFFAFQSPVDRFLSISWPSILWYYYLKNIHDICYRSLIHILVIVKINDEDCLIGPFIDLLIVYFTTLFSV